MVDYVADKTYFNINRVNPEIGPEKWDGSSIGSNANRSRVGYRIQKIKTGYNRVGYRVQVWNLPTLNPITPSYDLFEDRCMEKS